MKKDKFKTKVIFYKETDNILAVFPEIKSDLQGNISCYASLGQHSGMHPEYSKDLPIATKIEYNDLFTELENLGYNLEVVKNENS